ncbi:cell surface protein SprA [Mucilaginibacter myungsuensis]|uniref:Cell surface protein SprA n=1 Tax=Mucilaginibacter myungsuensis TaxID=649104 RepID=A0A929L594_9SPHI|nr:cell surface protein SprA [Mucilaginibacter myungsuensis]
MVSVLGGVGHAIAQVKQDSSIIKVPNIPAATRNNLSRKGYFDEDPPGLTRTIEYNPITNQYVLIQKVGNMMYRPPQYLTFAEYLQLQQQLNQRAYFRQLSDNYAYQSQQPGFIPQIQVRSRTFERIFGSNTISITPRGQANMIFAGQINSNENPLFNTRQRKQFNFNFDQNIQMNLEGAIGDKLRINTNYNTDAQYQFENQIKLDYTGHADEIIQKIEAGTVSMPLPTTLITGTQALFGLKTKLKFGKLDVTGIFSQQRSQARTITVSNQAQQGEFRALATDYEANRHFFLARYFRDNYNRALANIPIISSNVTITKIEVWTTNRTNVVTDSRDVIGFLDLGENRPYNTTLVQGGTSGLPAGFVGPGFTQQSNNLLANLPAAARETNSTALQSYFASTGGVDNYGKMTYARKLKPEEFVLHPQLGYISLLSPLQNDQILTVAYRYTYNGVEYQVGEFSNDIPVDPNNPKVLYTKLLKNEILKTTLPTWDLMMKNIYSVGAYQVNPSNFKVVISRLDEKSNIEKAIMDEGQNTRSKLWLQLMGLDNLNQQQDKKPDGYFDFIEGITIDSQNGRIIFPVVEPFGDDLARQFAPGEDALVARYAYRPLYDTTQAIAQQLYPNLNRYVIKGSYSATKSSTYQVGMGNIPQGSVIVAAGALRLQEGIDYTMDYSSGQLTVLNSSILQSGQPITIKIENNELFGVQQKSLYGTRFDYRASNKLLLGATMLHLTEQPITQKELTGAESISNSIYGFDVNYSTNSRLLTRLVDKLPFVSTKVPSTFNFTGEFAKLNPGTPSALNFAGSTKGTSYLDDFENSRTVIDIKSAINWQISGTPQMFPEFRNINDLSYGYNRARLAFYNIDPIFYNLSGSNVPQLNNSRAELSNHYVRQVLEQEVFPYKQSVTGQALILPTLDLAFYPNTRGPYNYTPTGFNADGTLQNPRSRWGGIFRKLETNDFESLNVAFIEFWMLDPFIYKDNSAGGDLYFNLGNISEDILYDGRKGLENGLPVDGDLSKVDETTWGRVVKLQPVINAFDSNPTNRLLQDVGLDGLGNADERAKFATVLNQIKAQLNPAAAAALEADPSSDDFQYYQGPALNDARTGILARYSRFNGLEGNSKTSEQSQAELGLPTSASTSLPDGEDINRDNNMNQADEYFQYRVSVRPGDLAVGTNNIVDKVTANVRLQNGTTTTANWYQFRIPIAGYTAKFGNIQDFKAIRFIRMFTTNFADTAVMRFATLQLVRGEWRNYNAEGSASKVIADPSLINPPVDNSLLNVGTVNIEENGTRNPIPYVVPPGIQRQRDFNNLRTDTRLNEQSLSLSVFNLRDGYSRAAFRTFNNDLRQYKRLQMFIHAEGQDVRNGEISAFIRLGVDYQDNYYEYEVPLAITPQGSRDPAAIWPDANAMNIELELLTRAKLARNMATLNGQAWPITTPFTFVDGNNRITIKGQPDLSRLRAIMLGVRNPLKPANSTIDNGLEKTAIVWFNELRLTDFDQNGGWATSGLMNTKLADFADVTLAGRMSTIGFGSIDQRMFERSRSEDKAYDFSTTLQLGKFFPDRTNIRIPMYINLSNQTRMPRFDPAMPDVELKHTLAAARNSQQRDSITRAAQDYTMRRSFNFTDIGKVRSPNNTKPIRPWDVENFKATYAFTNFEHRDFNVVSELQSTYRVDLRYDYGGTPAYKTPFNKIRSEKLALIKDINYSLFPDRLNFHITFDRFYSENTIRNNDPNNFIPIPTNYNKNFTINRVYGIGWKLTKSLSMDIDATNLSVVDEPSGRITGVKRDTLWENLKRLGRTVNYNHTIHFAYETPVSKLPYMDWTKFTVDYQTSFFWNSQPQFAINSPTYNVGNTLHNDRTMRFTPVLDFNKFYNKFRTLRDLNDPSKGTGLTRALLGFLTGLKRAEADYTRTEGTTLPGYLPQSNFFGQDFSYNAPGLGFLLGSQADLRQRAIAGGWLSRDTLQNQLYTKGLIENLVIRTSIEPFKDFRINLISKRLENKNFQTNFKFQEGVGFQNQSPITSGNYSISFFSLPTAFSKPYGQGNESSIFQKFLDARQVISERLGRQNLNSAGRNAATGFYDGYGANSQSVLVSAFMAAYSGKDPNTIGLNNFPNIPIPNWDIDYQGLSRVPILAEVFSTLRLSHSYRSQYTVNAYSSLIRYQEVNGASINRDVNNDFLPNYQFTQVTMEEAFAPLIKVDAVFANNINTSFGYNKGRVLSLSLLNSQLAQMNDNVFDFSFGYLTRDFRFPFGMFQNVKFKNDMEFKMTVSYRDNKTLIYRADVRTAEVSSGQQNITMRPSIDYKLSDRFNMTLFYDSNITKPYTSQTFNTSVTNFGVNMRMRFQ